jgi:hypothetical protein
MRYHQPSPALGVPPAAVVKDVPAVLSTTHDWVADWKLPAELRSAESPPWMMSYEVAPGSTVHERTTLLPPAFPTCRPVTSAGTPALLQDVATRYG